MDPMIRYQLEKLAKRYRSQVLASLLCAFWAFLISSVFINSSQNQTSHAGLYSLGFMTSVSAIGAGTLFIWTRFGYRDLSQIAQRVEGHHRDLNQRLLTSSEPQRPNESDFLRKKLIEETLVHAKTKLWPQIVPDGRLMSLWSLQWILLAGAIATPWLLKPITTSNKSSDPKETEVLNQWVIEPGNVQIEKGTDLLVTVRFPESSPAPLELIAQASSGELQTVPLQRSLKDPIASATLRRINEPMQYRIVSTNNNSENFMVDVYEHPSVVQSNALIRSPTYANQDEKTILNTRRISVVDGASVVWSIQLNKPVKSAQWLDESGQAIELMPIDNDPTKYQVQEIPSESKRSRLRLTDAEGRTEKGSEEFIVKLIPNRQPEVKLTSASDQRVSPIQEMLVGAKVTDDFGIHRAGVSVSVGDHEPIDIELSPSGDEQKRKSDLQHMIDLESLAAKADQLVTYHFWSEDLDREGQPRRVDSEMYFAEVRPFEETFREGDASATQQREQQQQQENSQGAQQSEELAELQKKIISGTWNLIRDQAVQKSQGQDLKFVENIQVLRDSQQQALEQSESLKDSLQSPDAQQNLLAIQSSMDEAVRELTKVVPQSASVGLRDAIKPMRTALEGLLRLRAREHEITQNQQRQSSSQRAQSASQSSRQQQIQQLQLEQDPNRYEEESQPISQESQADREMRQVMNRLDELARRQQDLNEQVRELDLALQAAKDEKEKNQLQDRLDRLREEQQELVQDSDELLERMNNPETRNALEESRQQIENAREQMQQSEQQLRNSQPSAALNSGSRAQENMEKTRQQLREQSSQALEKDVQRLVDQAQSIVEKQSQLEQQLQEQTGSDSSPDRRSTEPDEPTQSRQESLLRNDREFAQDEDTQQRFLEAWKEQKEDYQQLLNQIKDTVEQAEGSEPLLADQLYETYRQANQLSTEQRLDRIPLMIERGLDQPAVDEAQEVSKDLRGLRDRIEQSSKSVLGSDEESLRRALGELEKANRAIEEELAERGGADQINGSAENPQSDQPQSDQPQSDQPQSEQASGNEPRQGGGRSFLEQLQEQVARTETQAGQLRAPLTGEDYAQWTDRLRDIEELVRDPDLRAQAARVREAARDVRIEYKRHSKEPQWDLVKRVISDPLQELQRKVQQELIRKTAKQNELVPLDRDPVPEKYRIELDRYFESLGEERSK